MKLFIFRLLIFLLVFMGSVNGATRYLDVNATGANNGTSWTDAWTSFGSVSISGGDTLQIAAGTYSLAATYLPPSGTAPETPTLIQVAQDGTHSGLVTIDGGDTIHPLFRFSNDRWITIDGEYNGSTNLLFQNWGGAGTETDSFALQGSGGSYCHSNIIRYVKVINDQYMQADDLRIPISISYGKGCVINHCWVEGGMRASINITAYDEPTNWNWNVVEYTTIKGYMDTDGRGGPDGVKGSATVRYCDISHVAVAGAHVNPSHTAEDGIQWLTSWNAAYGNIIHNYSQSAIRTDVNIIMSNVWIFNNLIYSTHADDGAVQRAIEFDGDDYINCIMANNTIADMGTGIRIIKGAGTICDVKLYNNIIMNSNITMSETGGDHDEFIADYNLLLNSNYSEASSFAGTLLGYTQSHPIWDSEKSFQFVTYSTLTEGNNFRIGSGNYMGINTGLNISSTLSGEGFPVTDLVGNSRINGWDVGSYEYTSLSYQMNLTIMNVGTITF